MIKKDELTYKISEVNEDNSQLTKIEKRGLVVEFCLDDLKAFNKKLQSFELEINAKLGVEKAKVKNIEENYEFIKNLTPEEVFAVHMYQEAKIQIQAAEMKLEEIKEEMADYEIEIKAIEEQTGLKLENTNETNTRTEEEVK